MCLAGFLLHTGVFSGYHPARKGVVYMCVCVYFGVCEYTSQLIHTGLAPDFGKLHDHQRDGGVGGKNGSAVVPHSSQPPLGTLHPHGRPDRGAGE